MVKILFHHGKMQTFTMVNFYHGKIITLPRWTQKYHFTMVKRQFWAKIAWKMSNLNRGNIPDAMFFNLYQLTMFLPQDWPIYPGPWLTNAAKPSHALASIYHGCKHGPSSSSSTMAKQS
jgi:hypothetical protein